MALVLWKIRSIGIWAPDGRRALVNRREGSCTDLKVGKFVIGNFDGIPRVAVPSGDTLPSLSKSSQWYENETTTDTSLPAQQSWDQDSVR